MNENGKIDFKVNIDTNAPTNSVGRLKLGVTALTQVLRGDLVQALNSVNNALRGLISAKFGGGLGALLGGWQLGKMLDEKFGISDRIANAFVPVITADELLNQKLKESVQRLGELNAAKLDKITKEFSEMRKASQEAYESTLSLIDLQTKINVNRATTPEEQYREKQKGTVNTLRQMEQKRADTVVDIARASASRDQAMNDQSEWGRKRHEALANRDPKLASYYKAEQDRQGKFVTDQDAVIADLRNQLRTLETSMEELGSELTKASREMAQTLRDKRSGVDEEKKQAIAEINDFVKELSDSRTAAQDKATKTKADYAYGKLSPSEQLKAKQAEINAAGQAYARERDPKKRAEMLTDYYGRLAPERDKLTASRADSIKSARENIANARERRVGGASLGDVFTRVNDLKAGRSPSDDAAMQTAEACKIIAENTALLKELGVTQ